MTVIFIIHRHIHIHRSETSISPARLGKLSGIIPERTGAALRTMPGIAMHKIGTPEPAHSIGQELDHLGLGQRVGR